jgi:hypothetical protein
MVDAIRALVDVGTFEDKSPEPPVVIMKCPVVIRPEPVMQPQAPDRRLDPPADEVRTLRETQFLVEFQ